MLLSNGLPGKASTTAGRLPHALRQAAVLFSMCRAPTNTKDPEA